MPARRGKRIVDARPQSVTDGVGSVPLSVAVTTLDEQTTATAIPASTAATAATAALTTRGGRVTVSGVEKVDVEALPRGSNSGEILSAEGRFKVPAAVLQRIHQAGHSKATTHTIDTDTASSATALTSETAVRDGASVPLLPTATSTCGSIRGRARGAKASRSAIAVSLASPPRSPDSTTATPQSPLKAPETLPTAADEVAEATVSATVAGHHSAISSDTQDDGKGMRLLPRQKKPMIFSRQWRRHLFAGGASLSSPLAPGRPFTGSIAEDVLRGHCSRIGWRAQGDVKESGSDTVAGEDDDDAEDDALPFGKASVIKFSRTEEGDCAPGRLATAASSGDSGDEEGLPSANSASMMPATSSRAPYSRRSGATVQSSGSLTRRQRHQLRQKTHEVREHHRVRRHMAGFDPDFLSRHESRLQVHGERGSSEEGEDEESSMHSSEDETARSTLFTEESASLSSASSEESSDEETEGAEGDGDADDDLLDPSSSATHEDISAPCEGGFSAAEHREPDHHRHSHEVSGTAASPAVVVEAGVSGSSTTLAAARSLFFQSFFFACHEDRARRRGCHHTLIGLRDSVTIKGPCGIIGFGLGEVTVSGFYLGRKQLTLWHEEHRAVLMPMKRLKTRHAQDMELPQWPRVPAPAWPPRSFSTAAAAGARKPTDVGDALGQPLNPLYYRGVCDAPRSRTSAALSDASAAPAATAAAEGPDEEETFLQSLQWNCEALFGEVDWDWVEATVQSWRNLFSNQLPPILLIVQPPSSMRRRGDEGPTRRFYFTRKRGRPGGAVDGKAKNKKGGVPQDPAAAPSSAYMDIPSFVAHRSEPSVDLALVPSIVPAIAAQGCGSVMVLGSANIGKSTLCRYLANILLSQHGLCYWLDLDVGQPEFGVPGQLTLSIVRRPLLRARDSSCAQIVSAFFIGASVLATCPLTAANALAAICAQARAVSREHPVVVNTHGWVLQTGRRVSVEALRRLRPRQVIHLHKAREELWAQDTAALLDPRNGLNAEVVQRRFLVRHSTSSSPAAAAAGGENKGGPAAGSKKNRRRGAPFSDSTPSAALLCRLPYPHTHEDAAQLPASSDRELPASSPTTTDAHRWRGQVHSVRVEREETYSTIARIKATKGSRGRQQRWETYFSALLRHYAGEKVTGEDVNVGEEEPETTLLEAPLSALHSIVLAERDEKLGDVFLVEPALDSSSLSEAKSRDTAAERQRSRQTHAELAAALEHAVVAVLFHSRPSTVVAQGRSGSRDGCCVVRSLASLQNGFPVSCYGVVESCERELLHGVEAAPRETDASSPWMGSVAAGWIRIRVPLRPSIVAAMLSTPERGLVDAPARWCTYVSIAYSAALRNDTAFVDVWR